MPIEAVKIPQNVYVEDRIIGPVTLKQLGITGLGAAMGYILFAMASKAHAGLPFIIAAWTPTVVAAAFAFFRLNDLTLFNIILLAIEGMQKPKERYWSSHPGLSINLITRAAAKEMVDADLKVADNQSKLAEITRQLEKRQEAMDQLTAHEFQKPDAVDAVHTRFESAIAKTTETISAPAQAKAPVNPAAVKSDGLDPSRSIDGLAGDIRAYERLVSKAAS